MRAYHDQGEDPRHRTPASRRSGNRSAPAWLQAQLQTLAIQRRQSRAHPGCRMRVNYLRQDTMQVTPGTNPPPTSTRVQRRRKRARDQRRAAREARTGIRYAALVAPTQSQHDERPPRERSRDTRFAKWAKRERAR